ncbi:MAG: glycosyltransferase family 2 protein [Lachnospiraceae bacterium]|nr:glycosyltransferase family 2 protein [Lachnospiraceae bacterium]
MPCYNDGKYIKEAIQSLKEQTYPFWELVVIDDGSTDKETIKIVESLESENITVLHSKHLGPSGARNYGIQCAKGKYILPLDSDDKIASTYMEKAVHILENDSDIGVVYCEADLFGEKNGKWDLPAYSFEQMLIDNVVFITALFYKEDWEKVGGFNVNMKQGMEDYDFWLSILELGRTIYQIPEILFHYRIKPVSRTTKFQSETNRMKEAYRQIYHNHKDFYERNSEQYALLLRDALIEQIHIRMQYEKVLDKAKILTKIPVIRTIIHWMTR